MNDNGEPDYLQFIRDPRNGFRSMSLPMKGGTELSVKVEGKVVAKVADETPSKAKGLRSTGIHSRSFAGRHEAL
jgi:hypothetical protein